jgi:DNA invertase Pin-like site-specific DNA recombinase
MPNILAYYRVSTERQGKSGLGLEAQRTAVEHFAEGEGLTIVKEFIEIESYYDDIVDKTCEAWNFFANDPSRIASITARPWAMVSP